jgi:hypothetical protein
LLTDLNSVFQAEIIYANETCIRKIYIEATKMEITDAAKLNKVTIDSVPGHKGIICN